MLMGGIILNALAIIFGTLIVIFALATIGESCFVLMIHDREYLAKRMLIRIPLMIGLTVVGLLLSSCGADLHQWATTGKAFVSAVAGPLTIQSLFVFLGLGLILRGLCAIISTKMSLKKKVAE